MSETNAQGPANPTPQAPDTAAPKPTVIESAASKAAAAHSVAQEDKKDVDAPQGRLDNVRRPDGDHYGGWPAMSKTLREHDEEKVKACKEDIDTLLVFAGLYSAVLSAFVIESYQSLQPDAKDEIVLLLRHMAAQNYRITSGFLNSTDPLPPTPQFQAPQWAIRVNGLWFASLVFSLSAASIGMLVKQWLREFLAMENSSPQRRLRRRQYREPSLDRWRVFDIAAFLPVLLQASLGLFFVGLCFFTAEIHRTIGIITLPLVCGWSFFLVATTLSPLFSPRCPYKTTFLKDILKSTRMYLYPSIKQVLPILFHKWKDLRSRLDKHMQEEAEFLEADQDDTELLLAVDAVIPDNGLLSTILDAYRPEIGRDRRNDMKFAMRLVSHRTTAKEVLNAADLHGLSKQDLGALTHMISDIVVAFTPTESDPGSWFVNTAIMLLIHPCHPLSAEDTNFLCGRLDLEQFPSIFEVITTFYKDDLSSLVRCQARAIDIIKRCGDGPNRSEPMVLQWVEEVGVNLTSCLHHTSSAVRDAPTTQELSHLFSTLPPDLFEQLLASLTQVVDWHVQCASRGAEDVPSWLVAAVTLLLTATLRQTSRHPSSKASTLQHTLLSCFHCHPNLLFTRVAARISSEAYPPIAFFSNQLCVSLYALEDILNFYKSRLFDGREGEPENMSLVAILRNGDPWRNKPHIAEDLRCSLLSVMQRPSLWHDTQNTALKQAILSIIILSQDNVQYQAEAVAIIAKMWAGSGKRHTSPISFAELYRDVMEDEHTLLDAFFQQVRSLTKEPS